MAPCGFAEYALDYRTDVGSTTTKSNLVQRERAPRAIDPALGERVRKLRVAAGLTQTALAGERFSKEYISQIERGKTRPTSDTVRWLARRLDVDAAFLENGVSADDRARVEAILRQADALVEANQYAEALHKVLSARNAVAATGAIDLAVQALSAEARARVYIGEPRRALELLTRARQLVEDPSFSDTDRAEIVFQLGVCRLKLSSMSTAIALFDESLRLAEASELPSDALKSKVLHWRARSYSQQRDYAAARDDVERALELAEAAGDARTVANSYFQASLIAEREGHWIQARTYAEKARIKYEELADRENLGRMLNNLGGLNFLLGRPAEAVSYLKNAFGVAVEVGNRSGAGHALSSLAHVYLQTGRVEDAETEARKAMELLAHREDDVQAMGAAQLILGQSLLARGQLEEADRWLSSAEQSFEQSASLSRRAGAWVAQGDLATQRGDDARAARLYRRAAEALQDVRF